MTRHTEIPSEDEKRMAYGAKVAYDHFTGGKVESNPFPKGTLEHRSYALEWESLDYQESQILANQLEAWGL